MQYSYARSTLPTQFIVLYTISEVDIITLPLHWLEESPGAQFIGLIGRQSGTFVGDTIIITWTR